MKLLALVYLGTLIVLVPLDLVFLGTIGKKLFDANVGEMLLSTPRIAPAVLFYILYAAGVVIFVNGNTPAGLLHNALYGALFGMFCYATFELSNMAVLKHWEWTVVVADILWGATLTAVSALVGGLIANWVSRIA
jgi:uncharacterized membrane protein